MEAPLQITLRPQSDLNLPPKRRSNIHQCVDRKTRNPSTQQIVNARLSHAASFRRFLLSPAIPLDDHLDLIQEFGTQGEVRRLFRRLGNCPPKRWQIDARSSGMRAEGRLHRLSGAVKITR
jgi:hypothetical protein